MKISKKILNLILAGVTAILLTACSLQESKKNSSGSTKPLEQSQSNDNKENTKKEGIVLVDDDIIKAVATYKKSNTMGVGYVVKIKNKSDKKIIVQIRDTSVDGTMADPAFRLDIMPGKTANGTILFMNIKK